MIRRPPRSTLFPSTPLFRSGVADGVQAEVRLYDRLFTDPQPDAGGKDFLTLLNPDSLKVVTAYVEPSLANAQDRKSTRLNSSHGYISYAVFCLKKKKKLESRLRVTPIQHLTSNNPTRSRCRWRLNRPTSCRLLHSTPT